MDHLQLAKVSVDSAAATGATAATNRGLSAGSLCGSSRFLLEHGRDQDVYSQVQSRRNRGEH